MIGQSLTFYNERITCSNTGAGLQTGLSTLFWKRSHHPLRVVFLSITQLLRTCQGKPAALWVFFFFFFTPHFCIQGAYVSPCRCHKQTLPSKWSQLIGFDLLLKLQQRSGERRSVLSWSPVFLAHFDRGAGKHRGTFRLMTASLGQCYVTLNKSWKRQRDDIFTGPLLNTLVHMQRWNRHMRKRKKKKCHCIRRACACCVLCHSRLVGRRWWWGHQFEQTPDGQGRK